jgi:putative heme-binding domain-containing protein
MSWSGKSLGFWGGYQVKMADGTVHAGLVRSDSTTELHLATPGGGGLVLPRGQILTMVPMAVSMMPQGLDAALGEENLLDLVAYLLSLK